MSPVDNSNLELMRRALDAFRRGDVETLGQLFSRDVVWRVPGQGPLAGVYEGFEAFLGFAGKLGQLTNGTFKIESIDMFANERGGVFVDRLTAQRDGKSLDVRLLLYVIIRDGRIAEGYDHFHQEHQWDAFWS